MKLMPIEKRVTYGVWEEAYKVVRCATGVDVEPYERKSTSGRSSSINHSRPRNNRVIMRTRAGENRSREMYIEHCRDVVAEWERIVGKEGEEGLRTVWVMGALTTALEAGIARPKTGEEDEWLVANRGVFEARAQEGDEDFIELLREMDSK